MLKSLAVIALFVISGSGGIPARALPQSGLKAFFALTFEKSLGINLLNKFAVK